MIKNKNKSCLIFFKSDIKKVKLKDLIKVATIFSKV